MKHKHVKHTIYKHKFINNTIHKKHSLHRRSDAGGGAEAQSSPALDWSGWRSRSSIFSQDHRGEEQKLNLHPDKLVSEQTKDEESSKKNTQYVNNTNTQTQHHKIHNTSTNRNVQYLIRYWNQTIENNTQTQTQTQAHNITHIQPQGNTTQTQTKTQTQTHTQNKTQTQKQTKTML